MRPRHKPIILLLYCLLLLLAPAVARRTTNVRAVPPAEWQKLTADKAFSYKNEKEATKPVESYKPNAFQEFIRAIFESLGSGLGKLLLWIIVAGLVGFLAYKLLLSGDRFLFGRNKRLMTKEESVAQEEDITTTNWEVLRQQAISRNDTRLAVRYSYMWLLQLLQQHQLISYRQDKTNYEYYTELQDSRYSQSFRQLSRRYEYAWYGQFHISPAVYDEFSGLFDTVKKELGA